MQKSNLPYVEYTSNIEEDVSQNTQAEKASIATSIASNTSLIAPQQSRAVAKKSTAKRQNTLDNTMYNPMIETKPSHSIVVSK